VRPVDAAWGSHGSRLSPARRDAAPSMGRPRRDTLGKWRLEGAPTDRDKARWRRKEERWPRCSQRVGGVVVAGLAWAAARRRCRCSRWRPAPVRLPRGHERRPPRSAPCVPDDVQFPAPVRLLPRPARRGGGAPASSPNPVHTGGGERENPKRGWVAWRPCHAVPALLNRSRGQLEGEKPPYPWPFAGAGQVALGAVAWARLRCLVKGQRGL
jgi:hypothetical protein